VKVLVACEFSGIVRDAFLSVGFDACSCDFEQTERLGPHIRADVMTILGDGWDLLVAHPPCTFLASSGARWFNDRRRLQREAADFFLSLWWAPVPRIAIENPIGVISTFITPPDQIIQPWQFGHGETKATCLWLKNLPRLRPINIVSGRTHRIHRMAPKPERSRERSRTYPGIATAMAAQWGAELRKAAE